MKKPPKPHSVQPGAKPSGSALTRMIRFAEAFPDEEIVVTLSQYLSWSHFLALLPVKEPLAGEFYAELCRIERWDVRTLRQKIGSLLFQRTALAKKPVSVIAAGIGRMREGLTDEVATLAARVEEHLAKMRCKP